MAERTIILNAEVNTGNSAKDLQELDKGIKGATKSATDLNATFEDVYGDMKPLSARLGELEDRMYEMALAGEQNTKEFRDLQKEAVRFRKTIIQTDAAVDAFADTGSNVNAALQLSEGVVGGYEGFLGVTALMGVESEALMETLTKLQAVQSVGNSIQAINNTLTRESVVMQKAKVLQTGLLSGATAAYNAVVGTSTGLLKAFRIALAATGIGAIIVGVGLLVSYWDELVGGVKSAVNWFTNLSEPVKTVLSILFPFIGAIRAIGAAWDALFGETKDANAGIRKEVIDTMRVIQEAYEAEKKLIEEVIAEKEFELRKRRALGQDNIDLEIDILKQKQKLAQLEIDTLRQKIEQSKKLRKTDNEFISAALDVARKEVKKAMKEREETIDQIGQDITILELKQQKERNDNAKAAAEERKRIEEDLQNFLRKLREDNLKLTGREIEIELEQNRQAAKEKLAIIEQSNLSEIEKEAAKNLVMQNLRLQNEEILSDIDVQAKEASLERDKEYEKSVTGIVQENEKKRREERRLTEEQRQALLAQSVDTALNTFNTIANIAEAFAGEDEKRQRRAFKIQKAANIANATVEMFRGAVGAYSQANATLPPPAGQIVGGINAGLVIASGLANIKRIQSQKFQGGGGASASASGGSARSLTSGVQAQGQQDINLFGQANEGGSLNLGDDGVGSSTQGEQTITVKAQVVSDEISASQSNTNTVQSRFSA